MKGDGSGSLATNDFGSLPSLHFFRGLGEEMGRSWEGKILVERRRDGSGDVGQKIYEKEGREGIETVVERRGRAESSTRFFHRL